MRGRRAVPHQRGVRLHEGKPFQLGRDTEYALLATTALLEYTARGMGTSNLEQETEGGYRES